jgi:hypothetical protein
MMTSEMLLFWKQRWNWDRVRRAVETIFQFESA